MRRVRVLTGFFAPAFALRALTDQELVENAIDRLPELLSEAMERSTPRRTRPLAAPIRRLKIPVPHAAQPSQCVAIRPPEPGSLTRGRFCSAVKQPATTCDGLLRPKVSPGQQ